MSYVPPYAAGMHIAPAVMLPEDIDFFFKTVEEGKLDSVKRQVGNFKWLVNHKDATGATPAVVAAQHGQLEVLKFLKEEGADLSAADNGDQGAMFWAGHGGWRDVVEYLIDNGQDPLAPNRMGMSAQTAARANDFLSFADEMPLMMEAHREKLAAEAHAKMLADKALMAENMRSITEAIQNGVAAGTVLPPAAEFKKRKRHGPV